MSKELKVILLIFASLIGIVAIAVVALIAFFATTISHSVGSNDPAGKARTAAKIASFKLPAGYEYFMAMDMGVVNMVGIEPIDKSHRGFLIQMQGISVPSGAESDDDLMASMEKGLGSSARCGNATSTGSDPIETKSGKTIVFRKLQCTGSNGDPMTVEFGHIPSSYPLAIMMAMGKPNEFDRQALHNLVATMP